MAAAALHSAQGCGRATKACPPRASSTYSHGTPCARDALQNSSPCCVLTMSSSRACAMNVGGVSRVVFGWRAEDCGRAGAREAGVEVAWYEAPGDTATWPIVAGQEEIAVVAITYLNDQLTLTGCLMDGFTEHDCNAAFGDLVYDFVYDLVLVDQAGNEVQQICVGCTSTASNVFFGTWTPSEDLTQ